MYLIGVCIVHAAGRSATRHHIMDHNGRKNLPVSTEYITSALTKHEL